jgi:glycosyltransferase involved in cell wall biosynthesis
MGQDALHAPIFKRLLTTSNTHICCCSPFAASYFREAYGRMAHSVIPWGLDKEFVNNPAVRISAQRDIDVLAVGSLSPIKNYTSLVHIIRCLILTKPNIYCVIVGDGEERATLESQIRGYQLENNIFLAGAVMRHEVRQYMLRGRIFAHPAHFEAQGYVFLEALASGMSIISFEVGFRPCSKKVYTCQNMAEFTRQLNDLLHSPFDDNPVPVKTMDETVAEYVRYHNLLDFS